MKKLGSKAAAIVVSGVGIVMLGGGTAFAFWATTGTGTGTASSGKMNPLIFSAPATVSGLYPNVTKSGGSFTVQNDNPFAVSLTRGFGSVSVTKSAESPAGTCTPTVVSFALTGTDHASIPANGTVTFTYSATMTSAAENACQSASFSSTFTVTAQTA